jgi:hypothetical protein
MAMPVTCGCVVGVVKPWGINRLGVTCAFDTSLLESVIVVPPDGAGNDSSTLSGAD